MERFTFILNIIPWFLILFLQLGISAAQEHVYMYQGPGGCKKVVATEHTGCHVPLWTLLFLIFLITLVCLLLLGVIKGLIGLYICAAVGMWGIGTLIDLPRPLDCYQEPELEDVPVKYDATGWPIHPETGERSVRAVTIKTEFYLNVIFFLTYPLATIVTICSSCCFHESEDCDNEAYKCVNTIVFADCGEESQKKKKKKRNKNKRDIYDDEDSAEEKDTKYVLYQMQHSQQSLQVWDISILTTEIT